MAAQTRPDKQPDESLVMAAMLGDLRSFDELVMRYRTAAFRVARAVAGAELAEDAVQEALLLAFRALPSLEEPASFAAWLCAITRHAAMRLSRNARRENDRRVELDEAVIRFSEALARPFTLPESFENDEIRSALDALPPDFRLIVQLRFYDDLPLKRIASFLDLPLSTVKWRLHRAKQLMREQLRPARGASALLAEAGS
ncbi:MAG: sigma-70 family RNA polymerase sigma factor [Blastocatellia bacterium]